MIASTIMIGVLVMTFAMISAGQRAYDYGVANTLHLMVSRNLMDMVTQELRNGIKTTVRLYDDNWNQVQAYQTTNRTTVTGTRIFFQQSMGLNQAISDPVIFYRQPDTGESATLDNIDNDGDGYIDESKLVRWRDRGPAAIPTPRLFWDNAGAPTDIELAGDDIYVLGRWLATGPNDPAAYAGTVTLTQNSVAVLGSGTSWKTAYNGALFTLNSPLQGDGNKFSSPIQAVTNLPGTSLTLADKFPMATVSGATYTLRQSGLTFTYDGDNKVTVGIHIEIKDNYGVIVDSTVVQDVVLRNN